MTALRWIGEPLSEGGVTERRFDLERESGIVPGILWTPAQHDRPVPLVLMGHGGSGHKRADRQLMLARRFAGVAQVAAAAIDGPFHGDRVPEKSATSASPWGRAMDSRMWLRPATGCAVPCWARTACAGPPPPRRRPPWPRSSNGMRPRSPCQCSSMCSGMMSCSLATGRLFDLIGSQDKRLIAFPGPHMTTLPAAVDAWCEFLTHHLAG